MSRGMLRGAAGAWLGLIALQTFTTPNGSGAVGGLFNTINGLVSRALDPSVPAIPNRGAADNLGPPVGSGPVPSGGGVPYNQQIPGLPPVPGQPYPSTPGAYLIPAPTVSPTVTV